MGDTPMVSDGTGQRVVADVAPDDDWAVVKAIMDAQSSASAGLEQYMLYVTREECGLDRREVEACLDVAIRNYERTVEDLKAARRRVRGDPQAH